MAVYLEFENGIKEIEKKMIDLKKFSEEKKIDLGFEIEKLELESKEELEMLYQKLTPWQKVQVARHPDRPYTLDYIEAISTDFVELHGDRLFRDDPAIVGGLAKINGRGVMIIGSQKGRDLSSNLKRNFGYANPEGYRKALRLMKTAERFNLPILTLIDTAGAYPGLEAEERGQGEAIARNLLEMSGIKVPIISIVIGEGGSGGALAIGVADKVFVLENSWYSVISPEGCAAILFKDAKHADKAAIDLKVDAESLLKDSIIDGIIKEGIGGAHRNKKFTSDNIHKTFTSTLEELSQLDTEELLERRYQRFRVFGKVNFD